MNRFSVDYNELDEIHHFEKHLAGKHDQSTHGHHVEHSSLTPLKLPDNPMVSKYNLVSSSLPHVGLSAKAQEVASRIYAGDAPETKVIQHGSSMVETNVKREGVYTLKDGTKVYLVYESTTTKTDKKEWRSQTVKAMREKVGWVGSIDTKRMYFYNNDEEKKYSVIASVVVDKDSQGQGIATAMLEYARLNSPEPIFHSTDLSKDGENFASTTKGLEKHLQGQHDQSAHGRKGPIKAGFNNWYSHMDGLFASIDSMEEEGFDRGNATQAVFLEAAGFNGKPTVMSQADFDALEGETIYRAVGDESQVADYKDSLVQYAGEGSFGNGTYATNLKETTEYYAGDHENNPDVIASRTMEMKLLPDANVLSFEEVPEMRDWANRQTENFMDNYEKRGANPQQYQEVEWRLYNDSDWTNVAIMSGVDAVRFKVPLTDKNEYYTIILNRGKVAINGKP